MTVCCFVQNYLVNGSAELGWSSNGRICEWLGDGRGGWYGGGFVWGDYDGGRWVILVAIKIMTAVMMAMMLAPYYSRLSLNLHKTRFEILPPFYCQRCEEKDYPKYRVKHYHHFTT